MSLDHKGQPRPLASLPPFDVIISLFELLDSVAEMAMNSLN